MGHDCVVEGALIAVGDGYGDAFVFIVDLDEYFWGFKVLDLFLDELLGGLLH